MTRASIRNHQPQSGFTIVELLVATLVFSVVLLLVTVGILQITRVYFKGLTESNTQNTARSIIDTVSQTIQFSGGDVMPTPTTPNPGTDYATCVGNQLFSYRLGWQVEDNPDASKSQAWHGLVHTSSAACNALTLTNQTVSGRDLMGRHMRLAKFVVEGAGTNQYRVQVRVVYGDDDLLDDPNGPTASCKNITAGTQFCAVSDLTTVVIKRVQ
jgi:prepilin-type N-terminal cleavage/methylation domain-containing protein